MTLDFFTRLETRIEETGSILCVGLDPHAQDLATDSPQGVYDFCQALIEQTHPYAAAFKPNIAFFNAQGPEGLKVLQQVIAMVPDGIPVILDAKWGDISSTAVAYAKTAFEVYAADAVTASPYLGHDSIEPFIQDAGKGIFLLCKTSNPGADDLQNIITQNENHLYQDVARLASQWNIHRNIGLVVGATQVDAIRTIRQQHDELWILAPGIGKQGGDIEATISAGLNNRSSGLLLPVSRGISRAENPGEAAKSMMERFRGDINSHSHVWAYQGLHRGHDLDPRRKEVALGLLNAGCIKFGEFTLKSGDKSPFYIDLRRLVGYPRLTQRISLLFAELMEEMAFDLIAPLPYAALPIGTAVSLVGGFPLIYPRKEVKDYGTKATVEGIYEEGQIALVLDDLVTTGESKLEGIQKLQDVGLVVKDVVVLIDRQKEAAKPLAEYGYQLHSIFTLDDLFEFYERHQLIDAALIEKSRTYMTSK